MIYLIKTFLIFTNTLSYLIRSYKKNANITELKKEWALSILKKFNFSINIKNRASVAPKAILVGNHVSFLDIIVLMAVHPEVVFLSKKEVSSWPIIGAGAKRVGTIFVDRSCAQSRALAKNEIAEVFSSRTGSIQLAGFPSGTTCMNESKPWKKGLFEIAAKSNLPVQPFRIAYTPLRECAYIDDDNLFLSLARLFKTQNKEICFEWGQAFDVTDIQAQIDQVQRWARPLNNTYEEKAPSRSSHSFQFQ